MTAITSPAFPLPYAKELDCVWRITTEPERILNVRFEQLDMEDFQDCTADFVELLDSSDISSNKTLGKFCGTMRKAPQYRVVTTGPVLLIHMKTDFNVNAGGFKLFVTSTLGEKAGCGGRLTATDKWQTLTNPKDEDGNYPPALMCGWQISGPVGSQLQIRIDAVETERLEYPPGLKPNPECIDSLAVYDGQEFFSPVLRADICTSRTPLPKILYTSHRHAFVTFETDRDGTGKGFNISYSTVQNECGGWLKAESEMKALIYKGITREDSELGDIKIGFELAFFRQGLREGTISSTLPVHDPGNKDRTSHRKLQVSLRYEHSNEANTIDGSGILTFLFDYFTTVLLYSVCFPIMFFQPILDSIRSWRLFGLLRRGGLLNHTL